MAMNDPRNCEDTNSEVENLIEELRPKRYSHVDLEKFTSNFSESNILGSGAYGVVYKGQLPNGVQVAVKRLENKDVVEDFLAEVSTISTANHRNLIKLKGYCFEPNMRALVYEYMESGSLDKILYKCGSSIEWEKIYGIAIEIAKGLDYLHDGSHGQIIHYDIKAGNVLLDQNLSAKITDFGMAKLVERNISHLPLTRTRGTPGYNAPETWMLGSQVTYKCDVYSFGMMLFELLGKRNNGGGENWFPKQVWEKFKMGQLEHKLNCIGIEEVNIDEAKLLSMVALWCIQFKPENRPTMREVVSMLEKTIQVKRPPYPFPPWQFPKLPSLEGISKDDLESFYGIDGRPIQDAESFLSLHGENIPGSTDFVSPENESQVTFQPSTLEEGVEANVTSSAFSEGVVNPDVQNIPRKINYSNGNSYEGTWENGLRHGQGRLEWANGDVYVGEWKNDVREGHGKINYKNGDFFEGSFKNSKINGQGRFVSENRDVYYSGEWRDNDREGHGRCVWANVGGYSGEWKNNAREGQGRFVYQNGDTYNGEWEKDVQEGHGKFTFKNGDIWEGTYKNGRAVKGRFIRKKSFLRGFVDRLSGNSKDIVFAERKSHQPSTVEEGVDIVANIQKIPEKLNYSNGEFYEGTCENGLRHGQGRFVWANGDVYIGEWKNDIQEGHGRFVWAYGDEYYSGEWKDNVREGHGSYVWANKNRYSGEWKNNVREGQGRFVWPNGDKHNGEWKNDVREGHGKIIYKNGDIWEGTYQNGRAVKGRFLVEKSFHFFLACVK